MDWDGIFIESYNFIEERSSILIFDLGRVLVFQTSGKELDNSKLKGILATLRKLNY